MFIISISEQRTIQEGFDMYLTMEEIYKKYNGEKSISLIAYAGKIPEGVIVIL